MKVERSHREVAKSSFLYSSIQTLTNKRFVCAYSIVFYGSIAWIDQIQT